MFDIFLIFAQNIDRGYTLEPRRFVSLSKADLTSTHNLCINRYTPVYPSFTI